MTIEIPTIPVGVLVLLQFLAPYAVAIFVNPRWSTAQKKIVAIVVSLVLAFTVLIVSVLGFGLAIGNWWTFGLLAIVVSQASYALVTGRSADSLSRTVGVGADGQ